MFKDKSACLDGHLRKWEVGDPGRLFLGLERGGGRLAPQQLWSIVENDTADLEFSWKS